MNFHFWLIERRLARIESLVRSQIVTREQFDVLTKRLHDAGSNLAQSVRDASQPT